MDSHFSLKILTRLLVNIALLSINTLGMSKQLVKEIIVFLNSDGLRTITYDGARSDSSGYAFWARKDGQPVEEFFRDYLFFFPNDYQWDTTSNEHYNILKIKQGDSSCLITGTIQNKLTYDDDGVYTYRSWDGLKMPDGHFGYWNSPNDYNQFVYVWVVPGNIEMIDYQCNRPGEWIRRQNTIAYFGENVNDLSFEIKFRFRSRAIYTALRKKLKDNQDVEINENKKGLQISMTNEILFPSGASDLSLSGQELLEKINNQLTGTDFQIVISGHTDNQPIKGNLKKRYPSNWELSAARALTVLHYLEKLGIAPSRMEARALGQYQPKVSNDRPQDRAVNRRIELMISTADN